MANIEIDIDTHVKSTTRTTEMEEIKLEKALSRLAIDAACFDSRHDYFDMGRLSSEVQLMWQFYQGLEDLEKEFTVRVLTRQYITLDGAFVYFHGVVEQGQYVGLELVVKKPLQSTIGYSIVDQFSEKLIRNLKGKLKPHKGYPLVRPCDLVPSGVLWCSRLKSPSTFLARVRLVSNAVLTFSAKECNFPFEDPSRAILFRAEVVDFDLNDQKIYDDLKYTSFLGLRVVVAMNYDECVNPTNNIPLVQGSECLVEGVIQSQVVDGCAFAMCYKLVVNVIWRYLDAMEHKGISFLASRNYDSSYVSESDCKFLIHLWWISSKGSDDCEPLDRSFMEMLIGIMPLESTVMLELRSLFWICEKYSYD
ncbi:hypothetical protein FBU30_011183 [Linnemannia zychae]|nr:hypothetical protein FBU30_011183 [Linnemannia zychae]